MKKIIKVNVAEDFCCILGTLEAEFLGERVMSNVVRIRGKPSPSSFEI
jgi:hypothetical protein